MDIVERLRGYNPPDRTLDEQRQIAVDIAEAADEIERLLNAIKRIDGINDICDTILRPDLVKT